MSYDDPNFNLAATAVRAESAVIGCAGKLRASQPAF